MSGKKMLLAALAIMTLVGFIPIMNKIGATVGDLPQSTPIDVPSALRHVEQSYASDSAQPNTPKPTNTKLR